MKFSTSTQQPKTI
jgi:hypothetical protein